MFGLRRKKFEFTEQQEIVRDVMIDIYGYLGAKPVALMSFGIDAILTNNTSKNCDFDAVVDFLFEVVPHGAGCSYATNQLFVALGRKSDVPEKYGF